MKSQVIKWLRLGLNYAHGRPVARKSVYIGLSGGVDSSVSAALLKNAGYDVTGVFIRTWQPEWLPCTWREERRDAMRVAAKLDIPFVTLNLEKEYKRDVADYMISEYIVGRTPNPDVMCNKTIKFGAFYDWAINRGADYVATGHYSQIKLLPQKATLEEPLHNIDDYHLCVSNDTDKDQSYFLWSLRKDQLPRILFPIGNMTKHDVRKLADKFKLPTANKKDSQGICFLGMVNIKEFLSHYVELKEGKVLNENNEVIGYHPGAIIFTIGERHGFTITKKSPDDEAYYVIGKNLINNTIVVGRKGKMKNGGSSNKIIKLISTNWIGEEPRDNTIYQGRGRYRQELFDLKFIDIDSSMHVATVEPIDSNDIFASGQSLVIYDDDKCMGGGVIA